MIRSLFIPTSVDSYYLFSQRIVAGEITLSHVRMTLVIAQAKTRTVKKVVEKVIDNNTAVPYEDRVVEALLAALKEIGPYDQYYSVLPTNAVIFKELTLPFTSLKRIKMVLPFEIEPMLPFPLVEATVDCVITHQTETESTIYIAALKNDAFAAHLELLSRATIDPRKITVDILELYALYRAIYPGVSTETDVMLYVGYHATRIGIMHRGTLVATRYVPQGLLKLAKLLETNMDHLRRFGIDDEKNTAKTSGLFNDV